jgi:hypothetical protein
MMLRLPGLLVLAACALLCSSCSTKSRDVLLQPERSDITRLLQRAVAESNQVQSMTGNGSVSFETPDLGGSVYFRISLKKPDSVLIRFEGPFGMDAGFLFLSPRSYVMYNSLENMVTTGNPSRDNIRSVIPFDLSLEQIVSAFAGALPLPSDTTTPHSYVWDGSSYVLTYVRGSDTIQYWIDGTTYLVTQYRMRDTAGTVLVDAEASRFFQDEEMVAPRLITVSFPRERRQVTIYYSALTLNPHAVSFAYSIPAGAQRRRQP